MSLQTRSGVTRTAMGRCRVTFASADEKTVRYVDISCAKAALSFSDSTEINLTLWR